MVMDPAVPKRGGLNSAIAAKYIINTYQQGLYQRNISELLE